MNPQVGPLPEIAFGSDPKTQEEAVLQGQNSLFLASGKLQCGYDARIEPIQTGFLGLMGQPNLSVGGPG
jgi:hypothetical protein